MERVLDTAALLHWPPDRLHDGVCAPSQRVELERLSPARAMLVEAVNIDWRPVSKAAMEQAVAAAGGFFFFSPGGAGGGFAAMVLLVLWRSRRRRNQYFL